MQEIAEWQNVSFEVFRDRIYPKNKPAVLRGLTKDWPAARAGAASPLEFWNYAARFDLGRPVGVLTAPPSLHGRFFYSEDMRGFNFERRSELLAAAMQRLLAELEEDNPPATYIESAPVLDYLPGFESENTLELLDASVQPRIWIGNRITTQTHYDLSDNIACVVAGRRRFTVFPPEQLANLYIGPVNNTLSGAPISMVPLDNPEPGRFPRFAIALEAAQQAELSPGDAIFIPYFWWHHVQSLEPFNVLVNYWWNDAPRDMGRLYDCLLHAVLALRDLPENQRMAWRAVFDYFVFKTSGEPMTHLPAHARGPLGPMNQRQRDQMKQALLRSLEETVKGR